MGAKLKKHCARMDQDVYCSQVVPDLIKLKPLCFANLGFTGLLLLDDCEEKIPCFITIAAGLPIYFFGHLLEKVINGHFRCFTGFVE